jgi:acid phosphatase (class A)
MKRISRPLIAAISATLVFVASHAWWQQRSVPHYLGAPPAEFAAQFAPPSAANSVETRAELDELLAMQSTRTAGQVATARADRKTEIERFYPALGIDVNHPPELPRLHRLAERVEDDVRIYVRTVKDRFRRLRPYEIEPRLAPCIHDVQGDLSYPSGHAAFGYSMAYLLSMLVPERIQALEDRANEFARQRMMCGVHFRSDLEAGRLAALRLLSDLNEVPGFRDDAALAGQELRAALRLPPLKIPH